MCENFYNNNLVAEIDLTKLRENYLLIRKKARSVEVGAVVKADAYGLGSRYVVQELIKLGCKKFFVSSLTEALEIKPYVNNDSQIFVLHGMVERNVDELINNNFISVVNNIAQIDILISASIRHKKKLPCILNFDVSMNRLGIMEYEIKQVIERGVFDKLNILYIMGHLTSSNGIQSESDKEELEIFRSICAKLNNKIPKTFANSQAVGLGVEYLFDLVRSGSAIYGITKFGTDPGDLQEVASIYTYILQIHKIAKGEFVGYNRDFCTKRETIAAVVNVGYADGYIRMFHNNATMYIKQYQAKVIGNISMDLTVIDVTSIPQKLLFIGQKVEILGKNQSIYTLAKIAQTISYEVLTTLMLGRRIRKIYYKQ